MKSTHSVTLRLVKACIAAAALCATSTLVAQDSVADNIRPVASVCMAGQPCVGQKANEVTAAVAETNTNNTAAEAAPAVQVAEPEVAAFDAAAAYQQNCFACHASGAAGAPKLDDAQAWEERTEKGMDAMMANVINGVNVMPPKGLCMTCSDDDLRAIVDYMLAQ